MARWSFDLSAKRATEEQELVHTNVYWLFNEMVRGGFLYFITFTGDHSQYGYVYLIKYKYESFEKFKQFKV